MNTIYTIGYSTYEIGSFISILKSNHISAIADVRSYPYSKFKPEFNREILNETLKANRLYYVFLGDELGARSKDDACYIDGRADHKLIAQSSLFLNGIGRILKGLENYTIALMCAESDPINCHRNILVCRILKKYNVKIKHILSNGKVEDNFDTEERLLHEYSIEMNDMFITNDDLLNIAYDRRSLQIAYRSGEDDNVEFN